MNERFHAIGAELVPEDSERVAPNDGTTVCESCKAGVVFPRILPAITDDAMWTLLARGHRSGCAWIESLAGARQSLAVKPAVNDGVIRIMPDVMANLARVIRERVPYYSAKQAALNLKAYHEAYGMNRETVRDFQLRMLMTHADGIVGPHTIARALELGVEVLLAADWRRR